jgi:MscS family membrane protein
MGILDMRKRFFNGLILVALLLAGGALSSPGQEKEKTAEDQKVVQIKADKIIVITGKDDKGDPVKIVSDEQAKKDQKTKEESADPDDIKGNFELIEKEIKGLWKTVTSWKGLEPWKIMQLFIGLVITLAIARTARWFIENYAIVKFAGKTKTDLDDMFCMALGRPASLLVIAIGTYLSSLPILLSLAEKVFYFSSRIFLAVAVGAIAWAFYRMVNIINRILTKMAQKTENNIDDLIVDIIRKAIKILIVILAFVIIGQNILGLNITTLLAGAGIFSLAIAFAAQDTIANFFGSIMIILDKPFKVGERVDIGGTNGSIEHVGFRSTRMRTLDGHLVTVPNKTMANATVENIGVRAFIKYAPNLTLVYDTPYEQMQRALDILHEILDNHDGMVEDKPPRIYFSSFNDWALNISITCWFHPGSDYAAYVAWTHKTNMEILRRFNDEGLEFAFPTNTTYLAYDEKRKVTLNIENSNSETKEK